MSSANATDLGNEVRCAPLDEQLTRSAIDAAPAYTVTARALHWITAFGPVDASAGRRDCKRVGRAVAGLLV